MTVEQFHEDYVLMKKMLEVNPTYRYNPSEALDELNSIIFKRAPHLLKNLPKREFELGTNTLDERVSKRPPGHCLKYHLLTQLHLQDVL